MLPPTASAPPLPQNATYSRRQRPLTEHAGYKRCRRVPVDGFSCQQNREDSNRKNMRLNTERRKTLQKLEKSRRRIPDER